MLMEDATTSRATGRFARASSNVAVPTSLLRTYETMSYML